MSRVLVITERGIVHAERPDCDHGRDLIVDECAECDKELNLEEYFRRLDQHAEYPTSYGIPGTWEDEEGRWLDRQR